MSAPWYAPLSRRQRRRLAKRLDGAFWRHAFRPRRRASDARFGDPGVLEDLDLACRELEER